MTELWNIEDVMSFAKLKSKTTVYKLMEQGLSYIKINKSLRFNPETVKSFFLNMEVN